MDEPVGLTSPRCVQHAERPATPCARCGTFRCGDCLRAGVCAECEAKAGPLPPQPEHAVGFGLRAGGRLVELVFSQVLGLGAGLVSAIVLVVLEQTGAAQPGWATRFDMPFALSMVVGFSAHLAGATFSVRLAGVSIGKLLLGLRVVSADGRRPSWKAAFVRELGYFVDALFFGLIGKGAMDGSPLQQRHGDVWADTVVVRRGSVAPTVAASGGLVAVALIIGFAAEIAVMATAFVLFAR